MCPLLNMLAQLVTLLVLGSSITAFIAFNLFGSARRRRRRSEAYTESLHSELRQIVKMKKRFNAEFHGITDGRLHQRLKEQVELLCGCDFNDEKKKNEMRFVINALKKNNGSVPHAAEDLGIDLNRNTAIKEEVMKEPELPEIEVQQEATLATTTTAATTTEEQPKPSDDTDKQSEVSQETV